MKLLRMAVVAVVLSILVTPCWGGTINVPGGQPTIQGGINAATAGDIVMIADGTYSGPGNYNIDFKGKSITVKSVNGPETCIIDCQQLGRGFLVYSGETVTLEGVTVKNGDAGEHNGGGVYVRGSEIVIENCVFDNNRSKSPYGAGGAVYCTYDIFTTFSTFSNCTFTNNSVVGFGSGGAVYCNCCDFFFANCTFADNSSGSSGGAVAYSCGTLSSSFINCTFVNNTARYGGAVCFASSSSPFTNCTFTLNKTTIRGGAIYDSAPTDPQAPVILKNCIFWNNTAPDGAEIYENETPMLITYSVIQGGHIGEGNIDVDPAFISASNLYLKPWSPCIDTAAANGAPADDIDGYLRPIGGGDDMGAYEYRYDIFAWEGSTKEWTNPDNWNMLGIPGPTDITVLSSPQSTELAPEIQAEGAVAGKLYIESGCLIIGQGQLSIGGAN